MVGGGGGQPLLAGMGTSGVSGEKGTMSKMSVDCGFMEMLPACTQIFGYSTERDLQAHSDINYSHFHT